MTLVFPSPEFDDAVAAVCHGPATEAEMRALNELLRCDSRARDEYLLRVELHTRLASDRNLFSKTENAAEACRLPDFSAGNRRNTLAVQPSVPWTRRRPVQVMALAACLVLAAVGVWSLWFEQSAPRDGANSAAVAMLIRTVDARWGPGTGSVRAGSALEPGWLRLESGLAQVIFYSGARVVMEGPAEMQLVSSTEANCPTGRLLVEVPEPARGFRLKTDQLNVLDLGTAFGINATRGRTEVHVFNGQVELHSGKMPKQALGEGQAVLAQGGAPPRLMAANTAAFSSLFEFQERSLAAAAFRFEQWQFANARLNQDPSLLVHLEFQDLGTSDWTLHNSAKGNRSVPDATIVGCQRAEGRWREKQALEFQSVNDRVRLAVPGDFEALTLSAWVCVKGLDRQLNSLFMSDGFDPGTVHWLIRSDGVLGLTVFGPGPGKFQILASPPVITLNQFGMWKHLAVVVDGQAGQVVHYVDGSPVARQMLKLGPPFRVGAAELGNWNAESGSKPGPALIRNLSGALDEFELFSRALSDAEVRELYNKGKPGL
jgi:ferric-dicitrate binding protein FerR (iron transport regulator)